MQSHNNSVTNGAGHVVAATHRRFDLSVSFGALGNVHYRARRSCNCIMYQFFAAVPARHGPNAHSALFTRVNCHYLVLLNFV